MTARDGSWCGVLAAVAVFAAGCGRQLECGPGTVEQSGQCLPALPLGGCGDGGTVIGGVCYPADLSPACGDNTRYDPVTHRCIGVGTTAGCATSCSPPGSSTLCVTGSVRRFIDRMTVGPTASSGAKIRIYDPIAFVTNPSAPPLKEADIEQQGCFVADGVMRPGGTLVAIAVGDASGDATYALMGVGARLEPNRNIMGVSAYALTKAEVMAWQQGAGSLPAGCTSMLACGMWLGHYLDATLAPVGNVRLTRPGDEPAADHVFCFRGDRTNLTALDVTDSATGLCAIVGDVVEPHAGQCADGPGTCQCGTMPCNLMWPGTLTGTASTAVFYQPMPAGP